MVDSVEVELNGFLFLLGVGLVDLVLGLDDLEDGVLLQSQILQQLDVFVIVDPMACTHDPSVYLLEIRLALLLA